MATMNFKSRITFQQIIGQKGATIFIKIYIVLMEIGVNSTTPRNHYLCCLTKSSPTKGILKKWSTKSPRWIKKSEMRVCTLIFLRVSNLNNKPVRESWSNFWWGSRDKFKIKSSRYLTTLVWPKMQSKMEKRPLPTSVIANMRLIQPPTKYTQDSIRPENQT